MRWPKVASALQLSEFECVHAIGEYEYPLTKLITDLKFNGKLACAEALSNCFCASLKERNQPLPQLILPAPLHHKRYVKRQFYQAVEIAVAVAERLKIRCDLAAVNRHRYTLAQTELDRDQRLSNVAGAFSCNKLTRDITHIAIFDDVITTGATMCAMRVRCVPGHPRSEGRGKHVLLVRRVRPTCTTPTATPPFFSVTAPSAEASSVYSAVRFTV